MQPLVPLVFHNLPSLYPLHLEEMFFIVSPSGERSMSDNSEVLALLAVWQLTRKNCSNEICIGYEMHAN